MDVYTRPELTNMIMCYRAAGRNGRRALCMYQELFQNRNHPHHTMVARLYQRLLEHGSLHPRCIGDRVKREHLCLKKKCSRELATTPQLAHVPLSMPWVQVSLQCCGSCKNKTSMHTTSRMYKVWSPTTLHLMFDLSSGFCNGAS